MLTGVQSRSSPEVCLPEKETQAATPAPALRATQASSTVEAHPAAADEVAYAAQAEHLGQKTLTDTFRNLSPGGFYELEASTEVNAELHVAAKGRFMVTREQDGSFEVELKATGEGGAGVPVGNASAGAVAAAGTRLHFESPEGVADFTQAMIKGGVMVSASAAMPLVGHVLSAMGETQDASERLTHYFSHNLSSASLAGGAKVAIKVGHHDAGAQGSVSGALGAEVDLHRHTLTLSTKMEGEGSAGIEFLHSKIGAGGKVSVALVETYALSPDLEEKLRAGSLAAGDAKALLEQILTPQRELVVAGEIRFEQTGGASGQVKGRLEGHFPLRDGFSLADALEVAQDVHAEEQFHWKGELEVSGGLGHDLELDAGVGSVELSGRRGIRKEYEGTLSEVQERISADRADHENHRELEARRALR